MSTLRAAVTDGPDGPLIELSGETDASTVADLHEVLTGQLARGITRLTVDVSGLSYADAASVRVLAQAARTLRWRGGVLVLARPRAGLVRTLRASSADHLLTNGELHTGPATSPLPGIGS